MAATIPDEEFARLFGQVEEVGGRLVEAGRLPASPSFFETITAIAFLHFAAQGVHTAVLEVGLGGRLDATNIVEPLVSVITDISLDHTEWLGGTIAEIAREKAGILRRRGVMVTLPQHPEANRELGDRALALEVRGVSAAEYIPAFEWGVFQPQDLRGGPNPRGPNPLGPNPLGNDANNAAAGVRSPIAIL